VFQLVLQFRTLPIKVIPRWHTVFLSSSLSKKFHGHSPIGAGLRLSKFMLLHGPPRRFGGVENAGRTFRQTCVVKIAEKHMITVDILPLMDRSY
jgi:hypothetical protein